MHHFTFESGFLCLSLPADVNSASPREALPRRRRINVCGQAGCVYSVSVLFIYCILSTPTCCAVNCTYIVPTLYTLFLYKTRVYLGRIHTHGSFLSQRSPLSSEKNVSIKSSLSLLKIWSDRDDPYDRNGYMETGLNA